MGDIGLTTAYGLQGGYDALQQLLAQRIAAKMYADKLQQQQFDNALSTRKLTQQDEQARQAEADRRQRDREVADVRNENATTRQIGTMRRGTMVNPDQYQRFNKYGYGAPGFFEDVSAQPATLPSTQFAEALTPGATAPTSGGFLMSQSPSQPATPHQFRFLGTNAQDQADTKAGEFYDRLQSQRDIADARGEADRAKRDELNTYRDQVLDLRNRDVTRRENEYTDRLNPPDNPLLPTGVSDYLVQLRSKYANSLPDAEAEFGRALPSLRSAHPRLDASKAIGALRQMFGTAPGSTQMERMGLMNDALPGGASSGNGYQFSLGPDGKPILRARPQATGSAPQTPTGGSPGLRGASLQPGAVVTLKDGRRATVTKVYPDGTFEVQ